MLPSKNWQINVISLVENCLSYNISKSGRKSITSKWDNLNWTKTKYQKLCIVAFNRKFDYDDVRKLTNDNELRHDSIENT